MSVPTGHTANGSLKRLAGLIDPSPLAVSGKECEGVGMTAEDARTKLKSLASPEAAALAARFFKTGPGQYGEGDTFIGVNVPALRTVSREYRALPLDEIRALLHSPVHEERHLALLILVLQVAKCDDDHRKRAYDLYLGNTRFINNWDLVDCSAPQVVGGFLTTEPREPLFTLARSASLWERRIAIVSTQHFIRRGEFEETLAISRLLLEDKEDLIHKATGWTLREVGKKDRSVLEGFLGRHAPDMPRTMLRYAVEKFPPEQRRAYLGRKKPTSTGAADGR
jgi:3-methyladenine DNA glycosylase AlkD